MKQEAAALMGQAGGGKMAIPTSSRTPPRVAVNSLLAGAGAISDTFAVISM
jgi:hypothetical protein